MDRLVNYLRLFDDFPSKRLLIQNISIEVKDLAAQSSDLCLGLVKKSFFWRNQNLNRHGSSKRFPSLSSQAKRYDSVLNQHGLHARTSFTRCSEFHKKNDDIITWWLRVYRPPTTMREPEITQHKNSVSRAQNGKKLWVARSFYLSSRFLFWLLVWFSWFLIYIQLLNALRHQSGKNCRPQFLY